MRVVVLDPGDEHPTSSLLSLFAFFIIVMAIMIIVNNIKSNPQALTACLTVMAAPNSRTGSRANPLPPKQATPIFQYSVCTVISLQTAAFTAIPLTLSSTILAPFSAQNYNSIFSKLTSGRSMKSLLCIKWLAINTQGSETESISVNIDADDFTLARRPHMQWLNAGNFYRAKGLLSAKPEM